MNTEEIASRIISERKRLGLSVAQLAELVGITTAEQATIEAGHLEARPYSYNEALKRTGADPRYLSGLSDIPEIAQGNVMFEDEPFQEAVSLLRKSIQAVEAFVGEGVAASEPELVTALMRATLQSRYCPLGAGDLENLSLNLSNAIADAGTEIARALAGELDEGP